MSTAAALPEQRAALRSVIKSLCSKYGLNEGTYASPDKLTDAVVRMWAARRSSGERGRANCGRVYRGMKAADIPSEEGHLSVYVSKGRGTVGTMLSPFTLPFPRRRYAALRLTTDGAATSQLLPQRPLELVWQSAKSFEGETRADFYKRRRAIYTAGVVKRRYLKKEQAIGGAVFGGRLFQYIPSRVFYCEAYVEAAQKRPEMEFLQGLCDAGVSLLLLGPDGFPLGDTLESVQRSYAEPLRPFGHERVLVAMLRGYTVGELLPRRDPSDTVASGGDSDGSDAA
eukprot:Rhum_TRINITY_DN12937_c0_g1::Rhum_TRINITY_DN12937_c0_g1_i1::g.55528::m.55528